MVTPLKRKTPEWTKGRQTCFARLLCLSCFGNHILQSILPQIILIWTVPSSSVGVLLNQNKGVLLRLLGLGFAVRHFDWAALMRWVPKRVSTLCKVLSCVFACTWLVVSGMQMLMPENHWM